MHRLPCNGSHGVSLESLETDILNKCGNAFPHLPCGGRPSFDRATWRGQAQRKLAPMSEHIRITMNIITIPQSTPVPRNSTVSRPKVKDVVVKVKRRHARTSVLFMGMPYILVISVVPRFGRHIQNPATLLRMVRHPSTVPAPRQASRHHSNPARRSTMGSSAVAADPDAG